MTAADAPAAPRRVVVVAGMHRAGTSVVARGLQALGIDLGDRLMSADVRMNARGFFEDVDIVELDDALLDRAGADWKSVALLDGVDWAAPSHAVARGEARRLLEARLARSRHFGFKDPRVPRLLPFWQRAFAEMTIADAYVIAVRHPRAVVDSLTARDDLDARRSGWLWLTHLLCALRHTQGRPRVVVDYDRLLAAPERELARMARGIGLPAATTQREDAHVYAREFLTRALRHAQYAPDELDAVSVPPLVLDAHALAQALARDDADAGDPATAARVDALWARLAALSPLLDYTGAVERAADEVPRLTGELAWARASLADATTFNEDLEAAVARKDAQLAEARAYGDDLKAALDRKEGELVAAHATLARIGERVLGRMLLRGIARKP
jgi:hypothetical protein